jgi:hypothetical protein
MQLANGEKCRQSGSAADQAGGVTFIYECRNAMGNLSGEASPPNISTEPWTAQYLPNNTRTRISDVAVTTAWNSKATHPASLASQIAPFVGSWSTHGIGINIAATGAGSGEWRTYADCSTAPPPCDTFTLSGSVDTITDGGHTTFTIYSVGPSTVAHATSTSNQSATFPSGQIDISLIANDELIVTSSSANTSVTLCGKHAPIACFGA